jgi:hypothetical protein
MIPQLDSKLVKVLQNNLILGEFFLSHFISLSHCDLFYLIFVSVDGYC